MKKTISILHFSVSHFSVWWPIAHARYCANLAWSDLDRSASLLLSFQGYSYYQRAQGRLVCIATAFQGPPLLTNVNV